MSEVEALKREVNEIGALIERAAVDQDAGGFLRLTMRREVCRLEEELELSGEKMERVKAEPTPRVPDGSSVRSRWR